ncbi:unnamed protein product [Amoebophrya sp. A25]|nr:unnamed protein product [Amoebophrya sp. A25]|eukprot:GSA25T00011796001.1
MRRLRESGACICFIFKKKMASFPGAVRKPRAGGCVAILPCLLLTAGVVAETVVFREPGPEALTMRVLRMVGVTAAPDKPAKLSLAAQFVRPVPDHALSGVHVVATQKEQFESGSTSDFCCTASMIAEKKCNMEDEFVGPPPIDGVSLSFSMRLDYKTSIEKPATFDLARSGLYYVALVYCGTEKLEDRDVEGQIKVESSHGLLSQLDYDAMIFCSAAVFCLGGILVWWFYLCCKWRDQLVSVHYCLSFALGMAFVSACCKQMLYAIGNRTELPATTAEMITDTLGVAKFGSAVTAAVLICLGYGTAHESLQSREVYWLGAYGLVYFFSAFARIFAMYMATEETLRSQPIVLPSFLSGVQELVSPTTLMLVPEALIFGCLANWGYSRLSTLKVALEEEKQLETLRMMNTFQRIMFLSICSFATIAVLEMAVEYFGSVEALWQHLWMLDEALPNLVFYGALCLTLTAFAPAENFKMKAMSTQIGQHYFDDDDAELDQELEQQGEIGIEMTAAHTMSDNGSEPDAVSPPGKGVQPQAPGKFLE